MKTAPIVAQDAVYGATFAFNWLSAGGTAILLSGLVSVPMMPNYGFGKAIACFMRTLIKYSEKLTPTSFLNCRDR